MPLRYTRNGEFGFEFSESIFAQWLCCLHENKEQLGPNVVCYLSPHESQILTQLKFQLVSINRGINIDLTLPPKTSAASLIG